MTSVESSHSSETQASLNAKLLEAIHHGQFPTVRSLVIDKGADMNMTNKIWGSALIAAIDFNHTDIAQFLLDAGADIHVLVDGYGSALNMASSTGNVPVAIKILRRNVNIETNNSTGTPLQLAALYGHEDMVKILLSHGALVDANGIKAACYSGKASLVRLMLNSLEASISSMQKAKRLSVSDGPAPLHIAANIGNVEIIHALLRSGVDIDQCYEPAGTPLHIAYQRGHSAAFFALLLFGANCFAPSGCETSYYMSFHTGPNLDNVSKAIRRSLHQVHPSRKAMEMAGAAEALGVLLISYVSLSEP